MTYNWFLVSLQIRGKCKSLLKRKKKKTSWKAPDQCVCKIVLKVTVIRKQSVLRKLSNSAPENCQIPLLFSCSQICQATVWLNILNSTHKFLKKWKTSALFHKMSWRHCIQWGNSSNNMKQRCSIQCKCRRSHRSFKNKADMFHIEQQTGPLRG